MRAAAPPAAGAADIAKLATACLEDGCNVEMVEELLASLKKRESDLNVQLTDVRGVIFRLETLLGPKDSKQTTVEGIVASVARLFSVGDDDYPALSYPTGYSGDTHKGTKDAWDYKVSGKAK